MESGRVIAKQVMPLLVIATVIGISGWALPTSIAVPDNLSCNGINAASDFCRPFLRNTCDNSVIVPQAVACWHFNESSGTQASESKMGFSMYDNCQSSCPRTGQWIVGKHGNALNWTGNSYGVVTQNDFWNIHSSREMIAVTMWIKPTSATPDTPQNLIAEDACGQDGWRFRIDSGGLAFFFVTYGLVVQNYIQTDTLTANQWNWVAFTLNSTYASVFVNGVLKVSSPLSLLTINVPNGAQLTFASSLLSTQECQFGGERYYGAMDDVFFYDALLTPADISQLYGVA